MPDAFTTRPTLRGTFGMVSSTHWVASQVGMAMLEKGGNAYDAAVAAGFALHVVEPHLNGPGGDLPLIVQSADEDAPQVLCGQGHAPAAARIETFERLGLESIPGSGPLAAAVPGAVDAWLVLLRDRGTLDLPTVLEAAIAYARDGAPLVPRVGATVASVTELLALWPGSADLWMPGGTPVGDTYRNPAWAATLVRLAQCANDAHGSREDAIEAARQEWRGGFVADAIAAFTSSPVRMPGELEHPWLLTMDDVAAFEPTWEPALTREWNGHTIAKTGPWGQGPVLLQTLGILDALGGVPDLNTADGIHAATEAMKLAMADREAWYGDSADVPVDALLSADYLRERAALIGDAASLDLRPGSPGGAPPRLPQYVTHGSAEPVGGLGAGEPTVDASGRTRGDTCHVDVVDRWGNMVSATPSGGWLQSSPTIPDLGFCLGTRLQMMWLEPGLPASLVPGRRPRTTLSPTMVLRDGRAVMACGTPGGDQQDQWQLTFLLRHLGEGLDLQGAIDAPSFHSLSFPSSFWPRQSEPGVLVTEGRIDPAVADTLRAKGHDVRVGGDWSLGRLCAVTRDAEGHLAAAANPRGMQGYAVGR